jgi:hypothetical protein
MSYPNPHRSNFAPPAPPRRRRVWPWVLGTALVLLFVIAACSAAVTGAAKTGATTTTPTYTPGSTATYSAPAITAQPAPAAPVGPATTVDDGTYEVGPDMAPGKYKTAGPPDGSFADMCYWSRNKDDSGELGSIIANDIVKGPGSLTVKSGQYLKLSGGCTWVKS